MITEEQAEYLVRCLEAPQREPFEVGHSLWLAGLVEGLPRHTWNTFSITNKGRRELELYANLAIFHAAYTEDGWVVSDGFGALLYDGSGDVMSEREARDLAWAFNNGADNDDEAVRMNIQRRGGRRPQWLNKQAYLTSGYAAKR